VSVDVPVNSWFNLSTVFQNGNLNSGNTIQSNRSGISAVEYLDGATPLNSSKYHPSSGLRSRSSSVGYGSVNIPRSEIKTTPISSGGVIDSILFGDSTISKWKSYAPFTVRPQTDEDESENVNLIPTKRNPVAPPRFIDMINISRKDSVTSSISSADSLAKASQENGFKESHQMLSNTKQRPSFTSYASYGSGSYDGSA
jgi:hypothetical protein